jgi:hypothetical protein
VVTCGLGCGCAGTEACSSPGEHLTVGGAEQAVRAHLEESGGQHVLQKPTNTLFSRQRTGVDRIGGRFLVLTGDGALLQRTDAVVADGHPKAVRGQIAKGLRPMANRLTGHHPVLVPDRRIHQREQVGLVPRVSERGAEEHGQGLDVDQNVWARGEPSVLGRESPSRHSVMDVRMVASSAGPRMEDPHQADAAAEAPWSQGQCLSGLGGAPQAEVVEGLLVATRQRAECIRERQGHHAVRHRSQQRRLVFQPMRGLVLLALRTVPVLPGVVAVMLRSAGLTVRDLAAERLRAAPRNVLQSTKMTRTPPVATLRAVLRAMDAEHLSDRHHHSAPMRRLIASAPRCSARAVRCVSTLVGVGERCPSYACMSRRLTPASSTWVAQECRRVCTDACWWMPLSWRASLNAPGTLLLGIGTVAVDKPVLPRPGAGKIKTGWRCGIQYWRSCSRVHCGKGTVPIFPARPVTDLDQRASAVDSLPVEMGAFLQAQTTGVERGAAHAVARQSHAAEQPADLVAAEDHGQFLLPWRAHKAQGRPVSVEGLFEEELDAAQRDRARTAGVRLDILDVQEILSECFLGDHVWGRVIVLSQLAHGPDRHRLRTCRQTPELKARDHALAQLGPG